jgi:DNA topoisomerase IB
LSNAGEDVELTPEQEEVATWYATMLDTEYVGKPTFNRNFFEDFKKVLNPKGAAKHTIKTLEKCDFRPMHEWVQRVSSSSISQFQIFFHFLNYIFGFSDDISRL